METINKELEELRHRIKEFEEDRYCPNGCVEYQLDKLEMYKQYFSEISDSVTLITSLLQMNPNFEKSTTYAELDKIQKICMTAADGSKWI